MYTRLLNLILVGASVNIELNKQTVIDNKDTLSNLMFLINFDNVNLVSVNRKAPYETPRKMVNG